MLLRQMGFLRLCGREGGWLKHKLFLKYSNSCHLTILFFFLSFFDAADGDIG
uniref:Uncharacterized protein n=1 Tax=Glycine max TaxID=3847 RepID=C6TNL7_SOYBN|nr:unknown [Glycine max]